MAFITSDTEQCVILDYYIIEAMNTVTKPQTLTESHMMK